MRRFLKYISAKKLRHQEKQLISGIDNIYLERRKSKDLVRKECKTEESAHREYAIMMHVRCIPGCVGVHAISGKSIWMEHVAGGALIDHLTTKKIKKLGVDNAALICLQLCRIITECHLAGIAHLDLKLDNICLREPGSYGDICVIDFGGSDWINDEPFEVISSSYGYISPELIQYCGYADLGIEVSSRQQYIDIDIWCIGIILYILITGSRCPFAPCGKFSREVENDMILNNIRRLQYSIPSEVPSEIAALLKKIFVHEGRARPRISEIEDLLTNFCLV